MKLKLKIFTTYLSSLTQEEIGYVAQKIKTTDTDIQKILLQARKGVQQGCFSFDPAIDKRKYSLLKKKIEQILLKSDIDHQITEIHSFTEKILKDDITPTDESKLLALLTEAQPGTYYFREYYRMFQKLRDYLLIRFRKKVLPEVEKFLTKYEPNYKRNIDVEITLPQLTEKIIGEYELKEVTDSTMADTLLRISQDDRLDGHNRYSASVRLWFYYLNKGQYQQMLEHMEYFRDAFLIPYYPGRRVLSNYYANRLLLHSRLNQIDEALRYGWLSLKQKTSDYLFYVTNMSAVLSRAGRYKEAHKLMLSAFDDMRHTTQMYNKISFIAQYIHILIDLKRYRQAEEFAENYLNTAIKEVMATRWHLFFAGFFRALVMQEKFGRLLYVVGKYKIKQLEAQYRQKPNYLPTMSWYITLAEFMEGYISEEKALDAMEAAALQLLDDPLRRQRIAQQCEILEKFQPGMISMLRNRLGLQKASVS